MHSSSKLQFWEMTQLDQLNLPSQEVLTEAPNLSLFCHETQKSLGTLWLPSELHLGTVYQPSKYNLGDV